MSENFTVLEVLRLRPNIIPLTDFTPERVEFFMALINHPTLGFNKKHQILLNFYHAFLYSKNWKPVSREEEFEVKKLEVMWNIERCLPQK